MIKLVSAFIFVMIIASSYADDYYHDEEGKVYTIGQWGERRYGQGGFFNRDHNRFRVDANNILNFGWKMLKNIKNDNFVFSPLSPQVLLSCLTKETKNDSASYKELKDNVRYKDSRELEVLIDTMLKEKTARELKIASAFFLKKTPKVKKSFYNPSETKTEPAPYNPYKHERDQFYGHFESEQPRPLEYPNPRPVEVIYVNFTKQRNVKEKYNKWIERSTNGVIKTVDLDVDPQTEMILTSAIYFKGQWLFSFNSTEPNEFTLPSGEKVEVASMKIRKKYHAGRFDNIDATWAAIPYNSTEALVIILPNESTTIDEVIDQMNGSEMTEIIDDLAGYPTNSWLNVTLPKFKLNSKVDLKQPLENMGIKKIFTPESQLYLYDEGPAARVATATQQSSMEIDETGSIAASATAFSVVALTIERDHEDGDFNVNRPFIAVIIDRKYGVPLFIGKISDPRREA